VRTSAFLASLLLPPAAAALAADDGPPPPAFGVNRVAATISPVGDEADVDPYAASLAAGERLSVQVAAAAGSKLAPTLRVVGPDGADVDAPTKTGRGGALVAVAEFAVPTTGRWTVEVGGAGGSAGAYAAKFRVRRAPPVRAAARLDAATPVAEFPFDAVSGSRLSATLRSVGDGVAVPVKLRAPDGTTIPLLRDSARVRNGRASLTDFPLERGDGRYLLVVVAEGGVAACRAALKLTPPARPSGAALLASEPFLVGLGAPLEGDAGQAVRLVGAHFPQSPPYADVRFDGLRAGVLAVGPYGSYLDVAPPPNAEGALVDVVVANPDGQSVKRRRYFRYVKPPVLDVFAIEPAKAVLQQGGTQRFTVTLAKSAPALGIVLPVATTGDAGTAPTLLSFAGGAKKASFDFRASDAPGAGRIGVSLLSTVKADVMVATPASLASLVPAAATLLEGGTQTFTVVLDGPAPPTGLFLAVSTTGGIGAAPSFVAVPGGATSATVDLAATNVRAFGKVVVTSANAVEASVTVAPPATIDVSGWTIVQQNSSRTFTIPAGTTLAEGDYLVVARNAAKPAFESFWGRELGPSVVYLGGGDLWPNINGAETYELRDAAGQTVDGPSVAMASAGGGVCRRVPGAPAAVATSWVVAGATPASNADPGGGQSAAPAPAGVYVSEFADADGTGNFVFEFVELHFDRLP
jgi:hypothetical protein